MDTTFWFELGGVVAGIGAGAISAVVFLLKKRKINNSNDSIEVKNERKKRLKRNVQLGSIPIYKWVVIMLRTPKAILDNISS